MMCGITLGSLHPHVSIAHSVGFWWQVQAFSLMTIMIIVGLLERCVACGVTRYGSWRSQRRPWTLPTPPSGSRNWRRLLQQMHPRFSHSSTSMQWSSALAQKCGWCACVPPAVLTAQYRLMPPGQHHIVFTATKAFYIGSHSYACNIMALTTIACLAKKHLAQRVTNQDLPMMEYTFVIMASGL
jgi:hypothetical protein